MNGSTGIVLINEDAHSSKRHELGEKIDVLEARVSKTVSGLMNGKLSQSSY